MHEMDICPQGVDGLPVFSAEHVELQSTDGSKANDYENVVYTCSFCNGARRDQPRVTLKARLLDPTKEAWADHFEIEGDYLISKQNDPDAAYTHSAYDLNDPRKISRREARHKTLSDSFRALAKGSDFLKKVSAVAAEKMDENLIDAIQLVRGSIQDAINKIEAYPPVPRDAPLACRCKTTDMHHLSEEFAEQIIQIPLFF
jgi:hypothetical protein